MINLLKLIRACLCLLAAAVWIVSAMVAWCCHVMFQWAANWMVTRKL